MFDALFTIQAQRALSRLVSADTIIMQSIVCVRNLLKVPTWRPEQNSGRNAPNPTTEPPRPIWKMVQKSGYHKPHRLLEPELLFRFCLVPPSRRSIHQVGNDCRLLILLFPSLCDLSTFVSLGRQISEPQISFPAIRHVGLLEGEVGQGQESLVCHVTSDCYEPSRSSAGTPTHSVSGKKPIS